MFYCSGIKETHGAERVNLQMLCTEVKERSLTSGAEMTTTTETMSEAGFRCPDGQDLGFSLAWS